VIVLYVHPYLRQWLLPVGTEYLGLEVGIVLVAEALFFGLLVSSALLPVFYVYEGFALRWLTLPAGALNRFMKKHVRDKLRSLYKGRKYAEFSEAEKNLANSLYARLTDLPVELRDGKAEFVVDRPTRLGNIIAGYESYPQTRYDIDGLTFWSHLLFLAPEAARESYEERVAFGESMVLTSASGALVALLALCALCGRAIGALGGSALVVFHVSTPMRIDWIGFGGGLAVWYLFYRLSLPAHREVKSAFQALTDLTIPAFTRWMKKVEIPVPPEVAAKAEEVSAYLRLLKKPPVAQPQTPPPAAEASSQK